MNKLHLREDTLKHRAHKDCVQFEACDCPKCSAVEKTPLKTEISQTGISKNSKRIQKCQPKFEKIFEINKATLHELNEVRFDRNAKATLDEIKKVFLRGKFIHLNHKSPREIKHHIKTYRRFWVTPRSDARLHKATKGFGCAF